MCLVFHVCAGDQSSGLPICTSGTLSSEPSSQPIGILTDESIYYILFKSWQVFFFKIFLVYVSMCMRLYATCMSVNVETRKGHQILLELDLQVVMSIMMWVLGSEPTVP